MGIELSITYFLGCTVRRTLSSLLVSKPGSRLPGPRRGGAGFALPRSPLSSREGSYWLSSETEPVDWLRGDRRLTWRGRDLAGLHGGCGNAAGSVRARIDIMPLELELCPGRWVGGQHPCFIIAEIGQNHQGDLDIAKRMIRTAKECGADCAKFQKSELEFKFNRKALERPYTSKHSWGSTYGEHKRHLEFSHAQYRELQRYAQEIGIFFTASGMDEMAVEFLHELNVPFFKVGSGDTNNFPYLEKTAKKGRPMVISSGMQSMDTMKQVYQIVKPLNPNFCFLQCTSAYPLQPEDANLRVISEYQKLFPDIPIGYSGHETGIAISVAAVALGAKVLERHITLDKTWKGSDHSASLEPGELAELVRSVRLVERALGSPVKQLLPCEVACNEKLGKSVVAKVKIPEGTILTLDMLTVKVGEPKGYPPEDIFSLVGRKVLVTVEEDDTIMEDSVENHSKKIKS